MNATETARVLVMHDGQVRAIARNQDEAFGVLLRLQGQSVDYATTHGGWSVEQVTSWPDDQAEWLRRNAPSLFRHRHHAKTRLECMNCEVCCLLGYEPQGGWEPGTSVDDDGPNVAGWARLYVEARRAIPERWRAAFEAERQSDNLLYATALERSIATFGVTFQAAS